MEKILIIGGSGLLGSSMVEVYSRNYQVFSTYNEHQITSQNAYKLDVTQKSETTRLLEKLKPDFVIDTHGLTSVVYCEEHKEEGVRINVEGTRNIAEAAKASGCKYLFVSTDGIFDGKKETPYIETDTPNPVNYYGVTKMMAEEVVESLDMDYIIARTSILFGKGGSRQSRSFTNWVIEQLRNKKSIDVVTDQYNNPTYTKNLAELIGRLYEKDVNGIFHTAGKDTLTRFDFANKIAEVFDLDKNLILPTTTAKLGQVNKPLMTGLDISKVEKATSITGMRIDEALTAFKNEEEAA